LLWLIDQSAGRTSVRPRRVFDWERGEELLNLAAKALESSAKKERKKERKESSGMGVDFFRLLL